MSLWRQVGEVWSTVFPVGQDPDPAIVHAIRSEFLPHYVPLFHRKVFQSPTLRIVKFDYHAIGVWYPYPPDERIPVRLEARDPQWLPFHGGIVLCDRIVDSPHAEHSQAFRDNLPAVPIDYSWDLYHWMKAAHWDKVRSLKTDKEWKESAKEKALEPDRQAEKAMLEADRDAGLKLHDDRYMIRRAIEQKKLTDPEVSPPVSIAVP